MSSEPTSFYERVDATTYDATEHTRGPWDEGAQHGGPPSALLGHALDAHEPRDGFRIARIALEILGPIPIGRLRVETRTARPGRSVELLEGRLVTDDGTPVVSAVAWRMRTSPDALPGSAEPGPPSTPEDGAEPEFFRTMKGRQGYHTGMEFRFSTGSFLEPGPATAWFRMRVPLIAGEPVTPMMRLLTVTDTGNGISSVLDPAKFLFINTDVTVNIQRLPDGEWVCIDAQTHVEPDGIGLAESVVYDLRGRIGRATQSLFCAPRPPAGDAGASSR